MSRPTTAREPAGSDSTARQRILRAATELFAERGFHAVSIRDIAVASGVSPANVLYHAGSKQQLLELILAESFSVQTPLLRAASVLDVDAITNQDIFFRVCDAFAGELVRHAIEFPQTRRLWLRLLLDDRPLYEKLDAAHSKPLINRIYGLMRSVRDRGIISGDDNRLRFFISGVDWILDGYFSSGPYSGSEQPNTPDDPAEIAQLQRHIEDYTRSFFRSPPTEHGISGASERSPSSTSTGTSGTPGD